jgi:hypothetical protein
MIRTSRLTAPTDGPRRLRLALIAAAMVCAGCASRPPAPVPVAPAPQSAPQDAPAAARAPQAAPAPSPPQATTQPAPPSAAVPLAGPGDPPAVATAEPQAVTLPLEAGLYRCELGRRVIVRRVAPDRQSMVINWRGQDTQLNAVLARTGALRFENPQTGYVWLVIVGKSMLLDARAGRTLANECRL